MAAEAAPIADPQPPDGSVLAELMTAQELAAVLQLRPSTIEDYARRGVLPSIKLGRHRRFLRSAVEDTIVALAR